MMIEILHLVTFTFPKGTKRPELPGASTGCTRKARSAVALSMAKPMAKEPPLNSKVHSKCAEMCREKAGVKS